jgi:hypothetical protein
MLYAPSDKSPVTESNTLMMMSMGQSGRKVHDKGIIAKAIPQANFNLILTNRRLLERRNLLCRRFAAHGQGTLLVVH